MTEGARDPRPRIGPIIVVEGRDDTAAVTRAVDALTIETHGYGISDETWQQIQRAEQGPGIIVLTDPDHAGEQIRRRIRQRFPAAGQAFLERADATDGRKAGVEHASPAAIQKALERVHYPEKTPGAAGDLFSPADLSRAGLSGVPGAARRRRQVGRILGIGYGNARMLLRRLNGFGISREEFERAVRGEEIRL